tara:strand:+ start:1525 stop:1791 length:267 start_codon:yes stop_codon:yes gene_type:complete
MTTASEYNGWTNIETWNTALWLGNHSPGLERTILLIMNGWHQNKFADNLETYISIIWGDKTPDGHSLKPVNWVEIAESWIDAYKSEKE